MAVPNESLVVGITGSFVLESPYNVDRDIEYTISGVFSFEELRAKGLDPFKLAYNPVGLSTHQYENDVLDNRVVVRLASRAGDPVHVPSSYILALPTSDVVPYNHQLIGVSLGILPDGFDTLLIEDAIKDAVEQYLGFRPETQKAVHPTTGVITVEEHNALTASRHAAIKNRETILTKYNKLVEANTVLRDRITLLENDLINLHEQLNP